jgi:hypothetical protein
MRLCFNSTLIWFGNIFLMRKLLPFLYSRGSFDLMIFKFCFGFNSKFFRTALYINGSCLASGHGKSVIVQIELSSFKSVCRFLCALTNERWNLWVGAPDQTFSFRVQSLKHVVPGAFFMQCSQPEFFSRECWSRKLAASVIQICSTCWLGTFPLLFEVALQTTTSFTHKGGFF